MTKPMVVEFMNTWMVLNILEIGKKTNSTDTGLKHGLMQPNMRETTSMGRNMG
jgi:hypothetical protein